MVNAVFEDGYFMYHGVICAAWALYNIPLLALLVEISLKNIDSLSPGVVNQYLCYKVGPPP